MSYKLPRWDPAVEPPPATDPAPEALAPGEATPSGADRARFLSLSVELTGFAAVELLGTGVGDVYLAYLLRVFPGVTPSLLAAWQKIEGFPPAKRAAALEATILADPRLGPFARGVLGLWYTGDWKPMTAAWKLAYGKGDADEGSLLAVGYQQGLMWKAVLGAHPQAARPTGFGSWAEPPRES
jgi:hypothetical protein